MDYNRYYEIAEELEAEGYSYEEAWEKAIKKVFVWGLTFDC